VKRCIRRDLFFAAAFAAATLSAVADAHAQNPPPNAFQQGLSKNRGEPVKIAAASLEVRDKDKMATFTGDVHVVQGDTDMRCQILIVYYEGEAAKGTGDTGKGAKTDTGKGAKAAKAPPPPPAAAPAPGGQQQIRRMEAKGGVVVNQKDQTVTGEQADFDMRANTLVLTGNVVVTKGQDVLRGQKLFVNLTDGVSRMDSGGGRVEGLIQSTGAGREKGGPSPPSPRPARPN
jgi:lipopolysaccharide export system protein LptA